MISHSAKSIAELRFLAWKADPVAGYAEIANAIGDIETELRERDWLDYKAATPLWRDVNQFPNRIVRRNKIKVNLSEYITAFANTEGGLLIYGIGTEGASVRPARLELADDIDELEKHCIELFRDVVDPPLSGVEALKLPIPDNPKRGIVVVFTPQSNHPPHRAAMLPNSPYLMRVQDSCVPIPTGMLRNMFYPKVSAFPRLQTRVTVAEKDERYHVHLELSILNDGMASPRECAVRLNMPAMLQVKNAHWEESAASAYHRCRSTIHPKQEIALGYIATTLNEIEDACQYSTRVIITAYAEDSRPVESELNIEPGMLTDIVCSMTRKRASHSFHTTSRFID